MKPVVVVGAGIAGVTCARALADAGLPVTVVDRGRRIGGRMASRTMDGRPVDIGASYFTVADSAFQAVVDDWRARDLAQPWTDTFTVIGEGGREAKDGPMRWRAPRGLRSVVEDLAAGLAVESSVTVENVGWDSALLVDGGPASAVVLAMPDPQAVRLLDDSLADERTALDAEFEPVLALTATFAELTWDFDGAFLNDDPILDWVADDGRRRGDQAPVLVAHSSSDFAAAHLSVPEEAAPILTKALRRALDLPEPVATGVQRWSLARPTAPHDQPFLLSDRNVGACGDAWSAKPRVEAAYLSGRALGAALAARLV